MRSVLLRSVLACSGAFLAVSACGEPALGTEDASDQDGKQDVQRTRDGGTTRPPTELPVPSSEVLQVHSTPGIDLYGTILPSAGGLRLIFDHLNEELTTAELWQVPLSDGLPEGAVTVLPSPDAAAMVAAPSAVWRDGRWYLYSVTASALMGPAELTRRPQDDMGELGPSEAVAPPEPVAILSWPRFESLLDGSLAMAYRDGASVVKLALSDDGLSFGAPRTMGPVGAQPEIGQMADGTLVYTYQVGTGSRMDSFVRVSVGSDPADWETFTEPLLVTTSSTNVHDTDVFLRADGRADLYYIYPVSAVGFTLFRRCISATGDLGPEEQVVETSWGNLAKPRAYRLEDGRILLTFVDQSRGHLLFATTFVGDAACP